MAIFGRKKKQEQEVVEAETPNQDEDLAVAYGNVKESNDDDLSIADSVPPPPPSGDVKRDNLSKEDSQTLEDANDDSDDSIDEKKEAELIKRKKLLLIASCIISFFILLGLAIKYGTSRNENENNALTAGWDEIEFASSTSSPTLPITEIKIMTEPPQVVETVAPSIGGTGVGSASVTAITLFADCVANEISVLTECNPNGVAATSLGFCMIDDLSDQFWAWVSTPPRTLQVVSNDWGWMRTGGEAEFFLPEGRYEIGLFSNGTEELDEYPLITSQEFLVDCSL
jgi:hypothetical protein